MRAGPDKYESTPEGCQSHEACEGDRRNNLAPLQGADPLIGCLWFLGSSLPMPQLPSMTPSGSGRDLARTPD